MGRFFAAGAGCALYFNDLFQCLVSALIVQQVSPFYFRFAMLAPKKKHSCNICHIYVIITILTAKKTPTPAESAFLYANLFLSACFCRPGFYILCVYCLLCTSIRTISRTIFCPASSSRCRSASSLTSGLERPPLSRDNSPAPPPVPNLSHSTDTSSQ